MGTCSRVAVLLTLALASCSEDADCVSLCEDWVESDCCDKNDLGEGCNDDASQCEKLCEDTSKEAKAAGCKQELDDWDACAAELDDICDDNSSCAQEDEGGFSCKGGGCTKELERYLNCVNE